MSSKQDDKGPEDTRTGTLPSGTVGACPPSARGVTLMIYHRGGVEVAQLTPGQPLVVGRRDPADLRVPDGTLSREHARFTLLDGLVLVEDLGSKNGTWVARKRIDGPTSIELSGEVMLGEAIARVFALDRAAALILQGEAGFHARLEEEVTRAQISRRPFALLAVRPDGTDAAGARMEWLGQLRNVLRPIDRMSLYTHDTALVLLPEANADTADERALTITASASHLVGVALYPTDASSPENLIHRAIEALSRARSDKPAAFASTPVYAASDVDGDEPIVGATLGKILAKVERVARGRIPILLQGETGTGKEEVARMIHRSSPRKGKRPVCVNCGAIPVSLVESTLFGHEKGAFTGATQRQRGVFEEAHESTLFLDEIGDLPKAAQAVLLRVLEDGCFSRVGSPQEVKVNVRLIAATHRDLEKMVEDGDFREDLYHRLNTEVLKIPPLRDRLDEIEPLARHFLRKANEDHEARPRVLDITEDAMALLRAYRWPGNIRELRNTIERAVLVAEGDRIEPEDLPARLQETPREVETASGAAQAPAAASPPAPAAEATPGDTLKGSLQQMEKQIIEDAIRQANGNLAEATKLLRMSRSTLGRKMKAFGIKPPKR